MESENSQTLDQLHADYLEARRAYKEAEQSFSVLVASLKDIPTALNTRRDSIEVAGDGTLAINPPPAGPPWAQPATAPQKQIITRKEFARIDEYIAAFSDWQRKLEAAEGLYAMLPELDRQLGSQYRSPREP